MNARLGLLHAVLLATVDLNTRVPSTPSFRPQPGHREDGVGDHRRSRGHHPDGQLRRQRGRGHYRDACRTGSSTRAASRHRTSTPVSRWSASTPSTSLSCGRRRSVTVGPTRVHDRQQRTAINRRVSDGIVTSLEGYDGQWEYLLESSIRVSAFNPGFGGGTLADSRGRLMGVVSLNLNEIGKFTLAIPVECYLRDADELKRFGRVRSRPPRPWLGLSPSISRRPRGGHRGHSVGARGERPA